MVACYMPSSSPLINPISFSPSHADINPTWIRQCYLQLFRKVTRKPFNRAKMDFYLVYFKIFCTLIFNHKCSASRPGIESETNEDSKEMQIETLTIKATPLSNGMIKAKNSIVISIKTCVLWKRASVKAIRRNGWLVLIASLFIRWFRSSLSCGVSTPRRRSSLKKLVQLTEKWQRRCSCYVASSLAFLFVT